MPARILADQIYRAAVAAADPFAATQHAVQQLPLGDSVAVIAIGKAATRMAHGAVAALLEGGQHPSAGAVVSHDPSAVPPPGLELLVGEHPAPGHMIAGRALAATVTRARASSDVVVLISGGATSLAATPIDGLSDANVHALFEALSSSGAPINVINAFRRRVLRWAGGGLAAALHPATVHCLIVSDVMGGDLAAIGSGPCVADPLNAAQLSQLAAEWGLQLSPAVHTAIAAERVGPVTDFAHVSNRVILDSATAVEGARKAAQTLGAKLAPAPVSTLVGEAAPLGRAFALHLVNYRREIVHSLGARSFHVMVAGGECTVTRASTNDGVGGRCQEFALAAAQTLAAIGEAATGVTLLAAGTDGRDGPTSGAGAIIDHRTWDLISASGRNPSSDLDAHNAYAALSSARATIPSFASGTNVNDLVIGIVAS